MNWVLKYRTVRIPCTAASTACPEPSRRERSECVPPTPESPAPTERALPACAEPTERALFTLSPASREEGPVPSAAERTVAQGSPAERPAPRPGALAGRPPGRELACTERSERALSERERARRPHPACPEPGRRARHARICSICCHPDRDAIEEDFIHWHSPSDIAFDYHLPDRSSVYRHAHATGLFARRRRNLRFVLERLLERVDKVKVTAHAVIRAVRAYTRINDAGEWIEPPTRIIVSSVSPSLPPSPALTQHAQRLAALAPSAAEGSEGEGALPACTERSERACTGPSERACTGPSERIPTKARAKPRSNRHKRLQSR